MVIFSGFIFTFFIRMSFREVDIGMRGSCCKGKVSVVRFRRYGVNFRLVRGFFFGNSRM